MAKKIKVKVETPLERYVKRWINGQADGYDNYKEVIEDLLQGGCQSGMVGELIYYVGTVAFYKKHRIEISELLQQALDGAGGSPESLFGEKWDSEDSLALNTLNQNLLAWFGFEETVRILADRAGVVV